MRLRALGLAVALLSIAGFSNTAMARPVAKLVQVEGEVQYSRNGGTTWRAVRQTKYLFDGYKIRTGSDGNGKLINQLTGTSQKLGSNTRIEIGKQGVQVLAGALSRPTQETTSLWESLINKFSRAQRYTTVRRGPPPPCDIKVRTIKELALSDDHSELVWRNCGSYKYRLSVDGKTMDVASQDGEFYRHKISGVKPGEYTFSVTAIAEDGSEYTQRKPSTFVWLDAEQANGIREQVGTVGDDVFVAAAIYEANGLHVAALDAYREYFSQNPDDNDMRPMLVNSYQALKLSDLRHKEAVVFQKAREDDY